MTNHKKQYFKASMQIFLMVMSTFAFSFILKESFENPATDKQDNVNFGEQALSLLKTIIKFVINEDNLVSAQTLAIYTCPKSKDGKLCQEYSSQECGSQCAVPCLPTTKDKVVECTVGTCYDKVEGTCEAQAPKAQCEADGGQWLRDPNANTVECRKGCCMLGDQARFVTTQQCNRTATVLGLPQKFRPEIKNELQCISLSKVQEEGACVFANGNTNSCKFTTRAECVVMGGRFYTGILCSNKDLNTNCKPQAKADCVDGKEEAYWFDSCGNRENIYDADKTKSYNNGKVLGKADSCSIESGTNLLGNQKTCGNCNYFRGSKCGDKTTTQRLADSSLDVVCKDLNCIDKDGNKRMNGESWCVFQSQIGTDGKRSMDVPGSRYFKQVCTEGEVVTEPCADYRNEICVESKTPLENGVQFSSAACKVNKWQECSSYNSIDTATSGDSEGQGEVDPRCGSNPDCFIRSIDLSNSFKFDFCLPKYAPGFNLDTGGQGASGLCGIANKKCTVTYVKPMFGSWKCKDNCECMTNKFAEELHDVCMSLGDCGASVNYMGTMSSNNYKIKVSEDPPTGKKPEITPGYLGGISGFYVPAKGKVIAPDPSKTSSEELQANPGVGGLVAVASGSTGSGQSSGNSSSAAVTGSAITGSAIAENDNQAPITGNPIDTSTPNIDYNANYQQPPATGGQASSVSDLSYHQQTYEEFQASGGKTSDLGNLNLNNNPAPTTTKPAGNGMGNMQAAGAALGAVQSLLGAFGGGGGQGGQKTSMQQMGAILAGVGSLMMAAVALGAVPVVGWIGLGLMIIGMLLGLFGEKTKVITVEFRCYNWQPPSGGANCGKCGSDGLPCGTYNCASLGQTCEIVNEGTSEVECIDGNPNDVGAPLISPMKGILTEGYNYTNVTDRGFKITSSQTCIGTFTPVIFGISLNEPAQCKYDINHTLKYEDMSEDFGRALYLRNQTLTINIPSLESLGVSGYDPNRTADYNLYIRCQDKNGNKNSQEYIVNFCVKPGLDVTPPVILERDPAVEYSKYNATELNASVYLIEPAECRWSKTDQSYDNMENSLACDTSYIPKELRGWKCSTTFPLSKINDSLFYIRCKDQPWLALSNESARNSNSQSYKFVEKRSLNPLTIADVSPDNESVSFGTEPASVELVAHTTGGVDGTATCSYSFSNNPGNTSIEFLDTGSRTHRQVFESFFGGREIINVDCEDAAGNIAERTAKFSVNIDRNYPLVARVYGDSSGLTLVTNEPAECVFSEYFPLGANPCDFDFNNGTMMAGSDMVHGMPFKKGTTYYIKCKDQFDNALGDCSIIVKDGMIKDTGGVVFPSRGQNTTAQNASQKL